MNEALVETEQSPAAEPAASVPGPQEVATPTTQANTAEELWIPLEERWLFREPEAPEAPSGPRDTTLVAAEAEEPALVALGQRAGDSPITADVVAAPTPAGPATPVPPVPAHQRRRAFGVVTVALLVVALVAVGLTLRSDRTSLPSGAAFRVDGQVVTVDALQRRVQVLGALYGVTAPTDSKALDAFRRDTAKALVLSIVMTDAAHTKAVAIAAKVVNDALDRIVAERYPQGGRADFIKALAVQGIGQQDVQDELRRQLEVRQLFDQVTGAVTVSEAAARMDFLAHPETYQPPQTRHLRELVVADEATARSILSQLKDGASFVALAKAKSLDASTRSSGGDLGTVASSALDPAFAGPAFAATKGQAFGPVHTSRGWYVGVVDGIVQADLPVFEAVKDQVRQRLASLAQLKTWRMFLQQQLRKGTVQYAPSYKPSDPDALPDSSLAPGSVAASAGP